MDRSEEQPLDHAAWTSGDFRTWGCGLSRDLLEELLGTRLGMRLNGLIGEPTASIDVEHSCRPGRISAVANVVAAGHQGSKSSHDVSSLGP